MEQLPQSRGWLGLAGALHTSSLALASIRSGSRCVLLLPGLPKDGLLLPASRTKLHLILLLPEAGEVNLWYAAVRRGCGFLDDGLLLLVLLVLAEVRCGGHAVRTLARVVSIRLLLHWPLLSFLLLQLHRRLAMSLWLVQGRRRILHLIPFWQVELRAERTY